MKFKPASLLLLALLFGVSALAQSIVTQKPFTLKGQLKNFSANEVYFIVRSNPIWTDTIAVNEGGYFYYQTDRIKAPVLVQLSNRKALFETNLQIAPGYNHTVTADCKDQSAVIASRKITGEGIMGSIYLLKIDSIARLNQIPLDPQLEFSKYLPQLNRQKTIKDSVWQVVYGNKQLSDKNDELFKEMNKLDAKFQYADMLTWHLAGDTTMNYKQTTAFVEQNVEPGLLADLYNPRNTLSSAYRSMMYDGYHAYLKSLMKKQGVKFDRINYQGENIKIIADNYKGEIREKALLVNMKNAISYARSFEEINNTRSVVTPIIPQLKNQQDRNELLTMLDDKERALLNSQIGKLAPVFTATDTKGRRVSIADFKGRAVLIDLWASWCGPCRAETPAIKTLVQKYKADERLAVISVAVLDKPKDWQLAIETDKPTWLQLHDTDKAVEKLYSAYSIPKFIVVSKEGNIVTFDAPMPSDGDALEKILLAEMAK